MTSRDRAKGRLGTKRGERYALLPLEVAESVAYNELSDWARCVLIALLLGYHGKNNGCLGLTFGQARKLGIAAQWKLYAGLRVLTLCDLIQCTRRGRLEGGTKLPSLYAITWRGIDQASEGVRYDGTIAYCPTPSHAWARWEMPTDWREQMRWLAQVQRGSRGKNAHTTTGGVSRSTTGGADSTKTAPPRGVKESPFLAPPRGVSSKNLGLGLGLGSAGLRDKARKLMVMLAHLQDGDIARSVGLEVVEVTRIRQELEADQRGSR